MRRCFQRMELTRRVGSGHRGRQVAAAAPSRAQPGHPHIRSPWTHLSSLRCWRSKSLRKKIEQGELSQSQQAVHLSDLAAPFQVSPLACRVPELTIWPVLGRTRPNTA